MDNLMEMDDFRKPPNGLAAQTPLVSLGLTWPYLAGLIAKSRALHCHPWGCYTTNKGDECLAQIWGQVLTALLRYHKVPPKR